MAGLDTSQASAGNGNINLTAVGTLTVNPNATLTSGTGTLSLSAGVNADGTGSGDGASVSVQDSGLKDPMSAPAILCRARPSPPSPWNTPAMRVLAAMAADSPIYNTDPPEGGQVAYLQQQGSISQEINFAAGSYSLSLLAAQREGDGRPDNPVKGRRQCGGCPSPAGRDELRKLEHRISGCPAGNHTITLAGVDPSKGDNTAFIA